eukprot:707708_1
MLEVAIAIIANGKIRSCSNVRSATGDSTVAETARLNSGPRMSIRHKKYCRKEGEFKPNDLVQIERLKNKPELNHNIVRLVGPDKRNEGRFEVKMEGGVSRDPSFSVSAKNLNQLRPYDCRK